jgi:8-oxo-dGTP pyrophosphatase MutT (NUDIX family)
MPPSRESVYRFARNGLIYVIGMMLLLGSGVLVGWADRGPAWPLILYVILSLPASLIVVLLSRSMDPETAGVCFFFLLSAPALNLGLLALAMKGGRGESSLRTWDGRPITAESPFGATVVVYRPAAEGPEFLLLHRAHRRPSDGDDWEWTPPSGARGPGEGIRNCARRELEEETGLRARIRFLERAETDWALFRAEVQDDAEVTLSAEHDRYEWVTLSEAEQRCRPARVAEQVRQVFTAISG